MRCSKNDQNGRHDIKMRFCSMMTLRHTNQNRSETPFLHMVGMCYPPRVTHQTWRLQTTICFHRWDTHLLSSASALMKMSQIGSMNGWLPKRKYFTGEASINWQRDGKNVWLARGSTLNKVNANVFLQEA